MKNSVVVSGVPLGGETDRQGQDAREQLTRGNETPVHTITACSPHRTVHSKATAIAGQCTGR